VGTPRGTEAQVPGRLVTSSSILKRDFNAQHVGDLVAIAVTMECYLGAGRRRFLE
jgi:hypothetical protein